MRNDAASIGNVMTTAAPLVADVAYGTEDLLAAVNDLMTPALKARMAERAEEVRAFSARARQLRALVSRNPLWDASPLEADRVTYEVAQWADRDAIVVHEAGSVDIAHSFEFDPRGGRELFFYYGAHLGSGIGTAAGVQLARPGKQVVCLVGDGSFLFGPTALWNMARLELPVTVVVYNNHAYSGPHNRALANLGGTGRSIDANKFVHDYLGKPDIDMASIAKGFGVDGERAKTPAELKAALGARAQARGRRKAVSDRRRSRAPRPGLGRRSLGTHGLARVESYVRSTRRGYLSRRAGFSRTVGGHDEAACAPRPVCRRCCVRRGGRVIHPGPGRAGAAVGVRVEHAAQARRQGQSRRPLQPGLCARTKIHRNRRSRGPSPAAAPRIRSWTSATVTT